MKETLFDYDQENDSLFIYRKARIKGSVDIGDLIVDMSLDGKVVGIELLNASEALRNLGVRSPREFLSSIKIASIRAIYKQDSVTVYYSLVSKAREISSSVAVPIKAR
jgi:uncharacterized protein YuzE